MIEIGSYWECEQSYGDGREPWLVYREVRALGATWADTLRFEVRAGGELVIHPTSSIGLDALSKWRPVSKAVFERRLSQFLRAVGAAAKSTDSRQLFGDRTL